MIKKIDLKKLSPLILTYGIIVNEIINRFAKSNSLYYSIIVLLMILAPLFFKFNETIKDNRKLIALVVFELLLIALVMVKYFLE